jgi:hypothetical protein
VHLRYAWILFAASVAVPVAGQTAEPAAFEWGIEQRTRWEYFTNAFDYNNALADNQSHIRYRTRAWTVIPLGPNMDASVGLVQETWQNFQPRSPWRFDEIAFETANLSVHRVLVDGLSLRIGRQEFKKGDGFLFSDGSASDGSRTSYVNGINLAYARGGSKIEFLGISDPAMDRYLPRIHDARRRLNEWNESALGAYFTTRPRRDTGIEAYYFYKKETGDYRAPSDPLFQPDRHVNTAGGRLVHRWGDDWSAAGEFAIERGFQHGGTQLAAWGGYSYLKRAFASSRKPYVQAGYWAFSGDDPRTPNRIEAFDPLFSRAPRWGELMIFALAREKGLAYWSNLGMWQGEFGFAPHRGLNWRFTAYQASAFHPHPGDRRIFGAGAGRGTYVQSRLDFSFSEHWKGHAMWEHLTPGSFYSGRTNGQFIRLEMIYLWTGKAEVSRART